MSGLGDNIKGKVKEAAGKATGNKELEAKGKKDQIVGNLKERGEKTKDKATDKLNDKLDEVKHKTDDKDGRK